jgi:hypothetical protein
LTKETDYVKIQTNEQKNIHSDTKAWYAAGVKRQEQSRFERGDLIMGITIVFYTLTGNNKVLADAIAKQLSAEMVQITEKKPRKTSKIMFDTIFHRSPKVNPSPSELQKRGTLLFVSPVWIGKAASPLRPYLKYLKTHPQTYAFASISGGALNTNPGLQEDLAKWSGAKPAAFTDLHIADLLPQSPKPTMKDTSAYHLGIAEAEKLAGIVAASVRNAKLV